MKEDYQNYDICITTKIMKEKILKRRKTLTKIKILTIEELKKNYQITFNDQTIYYLMKKYNYQYNVAKIYLEHLVQINIKESNNPKIQKLIELKKELQQEKLLEENKSLKSYLKEKKIVIYNLTNLSKEEEHILNEIQKNNQLTYYNEEEKKYQHKEIIVCENEEEEITIIATEIAKLIKNKIDIKKIKIYARKEYEDIIQRIFTWYHIPTSIGKESLYTTKYCQTFLKNIKDDKKETLEILEKTYPNTDKKNLEMYNYIIKILNKYTWCNQLTEIIPFIKNDLKNTYINQNKNQNIVKIINSLEETEEEDNVFLIGFNQGEIPETKKDEDYFSDKEKELLDLDTTKEINRKEYNKWLKLINSTKNLTITMKKNNKNGECYISNLNDSLNLKEITKEPEYNHSHIFNQLELSKKLDTLTKYNEIEKNLNTLFQHYQNINYRTFNNKYQQIPKEKIKKYLNYNLTLSYSSLNTYYQCAFRYYLNNILKINIYEETFYTIIGNLYHHILSIALTKEINIKEEYQNYLNTKNYQFNAKEKYFLKKLEKELEFIIDTIKKQNQDNKLTNIYTEELIEIPYTYEDMNITFKGFVDKIMLDESKTKLAIIDYKTGNPDLNLNKIIYGLDLQLPIYVYLSLYRFKNARVVGFYLQKILNSEINSDRKHSYIELKEEKLKLQGYTNKDLNLLKEFDPHYENSNMIKGMKTTSTGLFTKKVFDDILIDELTNITKKKIKEATEEISNANFKINPKRVGMQIEGCKYCNYKDICFMKESDIINLKEYKNMEFLGGENDDTQKTNGCNMDR